MGVTLTLPIRDEAIVPFHTVESVRREFRGYDEDDVLTLCRWGALLAFDISSGDHDRRREIRILPASVDWFQRFNGRGVFPFDWEKLRGEIFKGATQKVFLRGEEVDVIENKKARLILNCSSTHLLDFVPRQVKPLPGSECRPGPNGSPKLLVTSLLDFLKRRRVK